jgi:Fur family transcriptional regulator, ferric uptake regulator
MTRATASDLPKMARLHARCFSQAWSTQALEKLLESPGTFAFSEPQGFVLARAAGDEAEILTLAVAPEARRKGIARALVVEAARHAGTQGARALFLEVGESNTAARALYEALGFRSVGRRKAYYSPADGDALVLRAELPLAPLGNSPGSTRLGRQQQETTAVTRIEQLCADKGLRMTEQRRIIARVLSDAADHPDAEELYRRASAIDPHISIATVYRTVKLFEDAGILERHDFRDGRSRYEEVPESHHDHLIDVQSGSVIEFRNDEIEALQRRVAEELGFELVDHRLELYGVPKGSKKR